MTQTFPARRRQLREETFHEKLENAYLRGVGGGGGGGGGGGRVTVTREHKSMEW